MFLFSQPTGLIYGAAIGDAIGISTSYMTKDEVAFHYNLDKIRYTDIIRDEHRVRWRQGDWTSDFDQMVDIKYVIGIFKFMHVLNVLLSMWTLGLIKMFPKRFELSKKSDKIDKNSIQRRVQLHPMNYV